MIELARRTVTDVLQTQATERPDHVAVVDEGGSVTYAELRERTARLAGGLRQLGVGKGRAVALMLDNSIDHACCWFATSWLRAVEVPVNTGFMPPQLSYVIDHCEAEVIVVDDLYLDRLRSVLPHLTRVRHVVVRGNVDDGADLPVAVTPLAELLGAEPVSPAASLPSDPLGILYTSGTTAMPKGVLVSQAQTFGRMWPLGPGTAGPEDTTLVVLPIYHVIGQCRGLYNTLIAGGTAVLNGRFSASRFWDVCRAHRVTYVPLVGAMAQYLLRQPVRPDDDRHQVHHIALGTTIPEVDEFRRRFAIDRVSVSYGLTEVGGVLVGEATSDGCGHLRPDFEAQLVDDDDVRVPDGTVGELVLRPTEPWTTMIGYFKQPEATVEKWRNLWLHTGDLMIRNEDGTYRFVDRRAERIRIRGENVSPGEVESQLQSHPAVQECAVVGVAAPGTAVGDQDILAVVVLRCGANATADELVDHLGARLPTYAVPRFVALVDELPRTEATHRVQRARLATDLLDAAWDRRSTSPRRSTLRRQPPHRQEGDRD